MIPDLKPGDVILHHTALGLNPLTWLSWCIRMVTRSHYNHASIIVLSWDKPFLLESVEQGVVMHPAEWRLRNQQYKVLRMSDPAITSYNERWFSIRASEKVGLVRYDFVRLFIFQFWRHITGHWALSARKSKDETRMICSEYVAWALCLEAWWQYSPEDFEKSGLFDTVSMNK